MLLENFKINSGEVIRIYDQAFRNAEKKGKNPGGDEIVDELALILSNAVAKWNLKNNFEQYFKAFLNWEMPENFESMEQYKCVSFQSTILVVLCEAQITHYKNISNEYKNYLSEIIAKDVAKINDQEKLLDIYGILVTKAVNGGRGTPPKGSDREYIQEAISCALQNQSGREEIIAKLEKEKLLSNSTIQAIKKHAVMTTAVEILNGPEKDPVKKLNKFTDHLSTNKKDLIVKRDSGFKTFVKGLGVAAASIFGLGIGGYFAYQSFFHSRGEKFMKQAETALVLKK